MKCEECEMLLAEQIDETLAHPQTTALNQHLAQCADCRAFASLLDSTEQLMRRAFPGRCNAAEVVSNKVVATLEANHQPVRVRDVEWRRQLRAGLTGFIAASLIFLAFHTLAPEPQRPEPVELGPAMLTVAHIRELTGPASCMSNSESEWQPVRTEGAFACQPGASIRTPSGTLCELETSKGCRIRMNQDTVLTFVNGEQVELRRGQVWCSSSNCSSFEIVARDNDDSPSKGSPAVTLDQQSVCVFSCPSDVSDEPPGGLQIFSGAGQVRLATADELYELDSGSCATFQQNAFQVDRSMAGAGRMLEWMRPLLVRKGHGDPELSHYVNSRLARIGAVKMAHMSEADIRSLGEYSVLPLLRYIQSAESAGNTSRRRRASALLADLSPVWIVPELVGLLEDNDAHIRKNAMAALQRLIGVSASSPEDTAQFARAWWDTYGSGCPTPESVPGRTL